MLNVAFTQLPDNFEYEGTTFAAKSEFHVTLLNARKLAAEYLPDDASAEESITMRVQSLLAQTPVQFTRSTTHFYVCKKDTLQSIIVLAEVAGLTELFTGLRQSIPKLAQLPDAAPHITLYVHGNSFGISIPNQETVASRCVPLDPNTAQQLQRELK